MKPLKSIRSWVYGLTLVLAGVTLVLAGVTLALVLFTFARNEMFGEEIEWRIHSSLN